MMLKNRLEAGEKLAKLLKDYGGRDNIVYALPRGGVIVGEKVAEALKSPLDLVITRKIRHPLNPEYAIGAVAESGTMIINEEEVQHIDKNWFDEEVKRQKEEARRRRVLYLQGRNPISPKGKTAIIVDDGVATGFSIKLAVKELKSLGPKRIIIAIPVVPQDVADELKEGGDTVVAILIDDNYQGAVGAYYGDFSQVSDNEVREVMSRYSYS